MKEDSYQDRLLQEIQATQPQRKLIGDCSETIKFDQCYPEDTKINLQIQCFVESRQSGYSIDRLLEYLKNETERSPRLSILTLMSCSKMDVFVRLTEHNSFKWNEHSGCSVMNDDDEQYHLTDSEKEYFQDTLKGQTASKSTSRTFMSSDNVLDWLIFQLLLNIQWIVWSDEFSTIFA